MVIRVRRGIAVREPRSIIDISRNERLPWQRILPADMQRVSLVVIEQPKAITEREVRQTSVDVSKAQCKLVGIGQVELSPVVGTRRPQCQLPAIDARALNRNREKDVG